MWKGLGEGYGRNFEDGDSGFCKALHFSSSIGLRLTFCKYAPTGLRRERFGDFSGVTGHGHGFKNVDFLLLTFKFAEADFHCLIFPNKLQGKYRGVEFRAG